jgi:hypothetical protein
MAFLCGKLIFQGSKRKTEKLKRSKKEDHHFSNLKAHSNFMGTLMTLQGYVAPCISNDLLNDSPEQQLGCGSCLE